MRSIDRWTGAGIAVLGAAVYFSSRGFPNVPGQKLGASTLPSIVAVGLFVCGLLLVLRSLRSARHGAASDEAPEAEQITPAFGILGSIVLYLVASDGLGYLIVAPVCMAIAMRALKVGWKGAIGWSIVASLAVHLAFYKLLKVPLPWGIVPVLY
jgi:putative tricarboxylic transport membrane protein